MLKELAAKLRKMTAMLLSMTACQHFAAKATLATDRCHL